MGDVRRARLARPCRMPAGLEVLLHDAGVSTADVTHAAQTAPGVFAEPRPWLTIAEYMRLWDAIDATLADPLLGVRLGAGYPEHALEPAFLVCLGSRDLGDALQRLARYKRCLCPERLTLVTRGAWIDVRYDWPTASRAAPPILVEAELSFLLHMARKATRAPIRDARMALTRTRVPAAAFAGALAADVRTGARVGCLSIRVDDLSRPFVTFNPSLVAALEPALTAEASQAWSLAGDPVAATRQVLQRRLGSGAPTVHELAQELALSARTLQRLLREAGTSFADLVQDVRRERAIWCLRHSQMTPSEIAYLLGFENTSSFFRAFTRWTGQTPSAFRRCEGDA